MYLAHSALQFKYLTQSDLEEASSLAAAAFAKTPCYVQMLPGNEDERVEFLKWLLQFKAHV